MLQIKKDLLVYDDHIKERLEFICKYSNKDVTFYNGNVISIKGTNLHYVEPHRFMINNHLFLFFNYSNEVYYKTLENKIGLKNLSKKLLNKVNAEAVSNHGYCLLFFLNKGGFKWNLKLLEIKI